MRRLHNLLASAKTLVDLVRVMVNSHYDGTTFHDEYLREIKTRFADDPLTQFVHGLRNYMLHYGLPLTSAEMEIKAGEAEGQLSITSRFVLYLNALAEWDGWNGPAKTFLDAQESDLDILPFTEQYHAKIQSYHAWIQARIAELHADDLRWLDEMRGKLGPRIT